MAATANTDDRILDAAMALVSEHGTRLRMDDIPERADVSRATLFRRFGNKEAVVQRLFARETGRVVARLQTVVAESPDPHAALINLAAEALEIGATHPLLQRVIRFDAQTLLDAAGSGDPSPIQVGRSFIAAQVRAARPTRSGKQPTADVLGDLLARLLLAYALVPSAPVDLRDRRKARALAESIVMSLVGERPA